MCRRVAQAEKLHLSSVTRLDNRNFLVSLASSPALTLTCCCIQCHRAALLSQPGTLQAGQRARRAVTVRAQAAKPVVGAATMEPPSQTKVSSPTPNVRVGNTGSLTTTILATCASRIKATLTSIKTISDALSWVPQGKTAVVVGGGVGGLVVAGRLAMSGFKVTILEKNAGVGGRMQSCNPPARATEFASSHIRACHALLSTLAMTDRRLSSSGGIRVPFRHRSEPDAPP